jgi:hypothetical protein
LLFLVEEFGRLKTHAGEHGPRLRMAGQSLIDRVGSWRGCSWSVPEHVVEVVTPKLPCDRHSCRTNVPLYLSRKKTCTHTNTLTCMCTCMHTHTHDSKHTCW